ncbi:MAG: class I SAM-dependent methyltransferase [Halobacteriota archaeon]|nr:class I SAM-dependent methyltransferase [Halobacteriota archaeon]
MSEQNMPGLSDSFLWEDTWKNAKSELTLTLQMIWNTLEKHVDFKGKSYLELGCGTGVFGKLALDAGAVHVSLLDRSDNAIKMCKDYIGKDDRVDYILSDATEYQTKNKYDIVISNGLIEHFKDDDLSKILKAHVRNSKDIVVFLAPASPHFNDIRCKYPWALKLYGSQYPISRKKMNDILNSLNLEIVGIERFYPMYSIKLNRLFPFQSRILGLVDVILIRSKFYDLITHITNPLGIILGGFIIGIGRLKKPCGREKRECIGS